MPRIKTDYSKTIIYVIKCKDDNITEEYIGSTTNFIDRKCSHKTCCNNAKSHSYSLKKYEFIRNNGGWDNWIMLEVEKYPCQDANEARMREEEIRIERKPQLNMRKAFSAETREEYDKIYYEENKDKIKEQIKKHYEENKEEISNKGKTQKWICPICNKEMREDSKNKHNKTFHQNF